MESTIFLRNITCLDHAAITPDGFVCGNSWHVCATVTGEVDTNESVVIDFSKCKKLLKSLIDDKMNGFDHKLLIFPDSNCKIIESSESEFVTVVAPFFETTCPRNAVQYFDIDRTLDEYLTTEMQKHFPAAKIRIETSVNIVGFTNRHDLYHNSYFSYVHGLKDSSSWGCQNQNHGHLSFVEVETSHVFNIDLAEEIASYLDNTIIINRENIIAETPNTITIGYNSSRGYFRSTYTKPQRLIVLDTETTIEYIIEHVRQVFYDKLKSKTLRISEGLQKGAQIVVR